MSTIGQLQSELSDMRRQRDALKERLASLKAAELAACELMVAKERIAELEQKAEQREADFRRVRETLERQVKDEQDGRERERSTYESEIASLKSGFLSPPSSYSKSPRSDASDGPTLRRSSRVVGFQSASLRESRMRLGDGSESTSPTSPALPPLPADDSKLALKTPAKEQADREKHHGRHSGRGQQKSPSTTQLADSAPTSESPAPIAEKAKTKTEPAITVVRPPPPAVPAPLPPSAALAKRTESFREENDAMLAIQRQHAEIVAGATRSIAELGRSIERITDPDDPGLKAKVEAVLRLWRLLQDRPVPQEEAGRYVTPIIRHENAKFVQVRLKIDRCLWEVKAKMFAIQCALAGSISRRSEEIAETKKIGLLLSAIREVPFIETAAIL